MFKTYTQMWCTHFLRGTAEMLSFILMSTPNCPEGQDSFRIYPGSGCFGLVMKLLITLNVMCRAHKVRKESLLPEFICGKWVFGRNLSLLCSACAPCCSGNNCGDLRKYQPKNLKEHATPLIFCVLLYGMRMINLTLKLVQHVILLASMS